MRWSAPASAISWEALNKSFMKGTAFRPYVGSLIKSKALAPEGGSLGSELLFNKFLVLQLQIAFAEGAGDFNPLKTGQKDAAFRPGPFGNSRQLRIYNCSIRNYQTGIPGTVEIESEWTARLRGGQLPDWMSLRPPASSTSPVPKGEGPGAPST